MELVAASTFIDWKVLVIPPRNGPCGSRVMSSALCCGRSRWGSVVSITGQSCAIRPSVPPQPVRDWQWVDLDPSPLGGLVTLPVQLAMVDTAYRDNELVADLEA
jgi:hypothetical protein